MTTPADQHAGPTAVHFKTIGLGVRPTVTVTAKAVQYQVISANWLTWTVVVLSGGVALFAWPWILFGKKQVTIPRSSISSVDVKSGASWSTLQLASSTGMIEFKTDNATAAQAREVLFA
ncbi:hypothetical protein [Demequina mangrovi]|uniref:PH domain-containing protein n=1 Tax=Demequina mangrovi TaxID=1043493 RepID=A0A1H6UMW2_9MICO|nr:hypothetical protein [Demequina mangrovi]SEI93703.1 hypothetical protein SAMN05421637_0465 [Demequina mangrovi]